MQAWQARFIRISYLIILTIFTTVRRAILIVDGKMVYNQYSIFLRVKWLHWSINICFAWRDCVAPVSCRCLFNWNYVEYMQSRVGFKSINGWFTANGNIQYLSVLNVDWPNNTCTSTDHTTTRAILIRSASHAYREILRHLEAGKFMASLTSRLGHHVAIDEVHEMKL